MKKMMKKVMMTMLSLIVAFGMAVTAVSAASPAGNANLGVKPTTNSTATFTAYEVLEAALEGKDNNGNPVYSYSINPAFNGFFGNRNYGSYKFENGVIKTKDGEEIDTDGLQNIKGTAAAKLASQLEDYAVKNNIQGTDITNKQVSVKKGLYLVVETNTPGDDTNGLVSSKPMLVDVTNNKVEINPKDDKITLEKKIGQDEDGKTYQGLTDDKQYILDENNKTIGDTINYRVKSTIPEYKVEANDPTAKINKEKLKYEFSDTFTNIIFNENSMKVKIGDQFITSGYTLTPGADKKSFKLALDADTILAHQGEDIYLYYTGTLGPDAVVNSTEGNPNTVTLTYSNNPNKEDSYDTLKDEVKTFTYGFKLHKVDKDNDNLDLEGAVFTITDSKGNNVGSFTYVNGQIKSSGSVKTNAQGLAEVSGLDAGDYTITETVAPKDYSLIGSPIKVTISDQGGKTTPNGIGIITVTDGSGGAASVEVGTSAGTGQIDLVVKVKDSKGISLPETGSQAAMLCMVGGAFLLLVGGVFLTLAKKADK